MKETEKKGFIIEFGDLSPWLKTFVVLGWIIIGLWLLLFMAGFMMALLGVE